ncbi:MAG: hypothetical protein F6K31_19200 [Symploca sp. SIO2G7]|nr:hypothetical protein [Symploca sp. SIO2G7]
MSWTNATWGQIGRDIAEAMTDGQDSDDSLLRSLAEKALSEIRRRESEYKKQQSALGQISKYIHKKFPPQEEEDINYWFDPKGKKENQKKWRHNIFNYLTLGRRDSAKETVKTTSEETEKTTDQPTLDNMTINQLNLEEETQQTLERALEHSRMPLDEFIKQAISVYAKTITGKARKHSEDLSNVPTAELLSDAQWTTHPLRASELTKRAIRAIKFYNANKVKENKDRWCITQSAIASLTGSRQSTIKKILERYKNDISSHNQTYGLNGYSNRKPGKDISEEIDMAELIPNGVD